MKTKNIILLYMMILTSTCNGMSVTNDAEIMALRKQIKQEAQQDLLLAFVQKQTFFQARQTAIQATTLMCNLMLITIGISIMYDLSTIKQIMWKR